jgi:carboxylesterase
MPSSAPTADDPRMLPFARGEGDLTAILVHGFTGSPLEMRWLGEELARRGFRAVGVRLPGHGLDPLALERADAFDWINEARAALLATPQGKPAFLVGLSMGAMIAAILAADHPTRVTGVALLAPPLRLRLGARALLAAAALPPLRRRVRFMAKRASDLRDPEMRAQFVGVDRVPSAAAVQFERVRMLGRLALPRVAAPALIIGSSQDRTVAPSSVGDCAKLIGSRPARVVSLTQSSHVLTLDVERAKVAEEIDRFFRGLLPSPAEGSSRSSAHRK